MAALMVLSPNFPSGGGDDSNHEVSGPLHYFDYFFIFNSFDDTISLND
jgi:hypothetical protein